MERQERLSALYREYSPKIMGYIHSHGIVGHDAEDVSQDIFTKLCQRYESYDPALAGYGTWIYTITRSCVADHYRRYKPTQHCELNEDILSLDIPVETQVLLQENLEQLRECLKALPQRQRDILLLYYARDENLKAIAEKMAISHPNARMIKTRGLRSLEKCMKKECCTWDASGV